MLEILEPRDGPVIDGLEASEVVYAKDQPEYRPLRVLRSNGQSGMVLTRFTLTPEQRAEVAMGADVYLEILTFHQPLQPLLLYVGHDVNPEYIAQRYGL